MDDVTGAMEAHLRRSDSPRQEFHGLSSGLNGTSRLGRLPAVMYVTPDSVLVGSIRVRMLGRNEVVVERFARSEIMRVVEGDQPVTGLAGALERKNARSALGRAMGASSSEPAVTLVTRRGDLIFAFKRKDLGKCRQAFVAISDLIR